jgi:hypothetical protein
MFVFQRSLKSTFAVRPLRELMERICPVTRSRKRLFQASGPFGAYSPETGARSRRMSLVISATSFVLRGPVTLSADWRWCVGDLNRDRASPATISDRSPTAASSATRFFIPELLTPSAADCFGPNVAHQPRRATGIRHGTEMSSRSRLMSCVHNAAKRQPALTCTALVVTTTESDSYSVGRLCRGARYQPTWCPVAHS